MASDPIPRTHPFVGMGKPRYHSNVMIMKLQMTSESCEEGQRAAKSLSITDMGPRHVRLTPRQSDVFFQC